MTRVGTPTVISVMAAMITTQTAVAVALIFVEPTSCSADRYAGDGRYRMIPAVSAASRPPCLAALVTRDSPLVILA